MNKESMRSLGVGVLLSAVILGGYAYFNQNVAPTNDSKNTELLASMESENQKLKSEQLVLNDEIAKLRGGNRTGSSTTASPNQSASSGSNSNANRPDESNENASVETNEAGLALPDEVGTFSVAEGSVTSDIAAQLEAAGYITSAAEFTSLIEEWGLESVIVAGDYELNSDMSIHDIANIITQGAYNYY